MKKIILVLTIFVFFLPCVSAQNNTPMVTVTFPEELPPGVPSAITFIIDHPVPDEVFITAPRFPLSLTLDRVVKFPRTMGGQVRTVVEYWLIPNTSAPHETGRFTMDSFAVHTPAGIVETGAFTLNIPNTSTERITTPQLFWERPSAVAAGERITLTLRANGWTLPQPPPAFFMPEVPQGVILALSTVSAAERASGIVLKMTLVPLAPGDFNLPARVLQHGNTRFEIPALHIRVTPRVQ